MSPSKNVEREDETVPSKLEKDLLFDLLQNNRRRAVLRTLDEQGELTLSQLAEVIAAEENDVLPSEVSKSARRSVYISLYQRHVPKLAEYGVVDYDREESTVALREPASQLLSHIYLDEKTGDPQPRDSTVSNIFRRLFEQ
jgi:DNA-binding transcriptional ArsR family regulator